MHVKGVAIFAVVVTLAAWATGDVIGLTEDAAGSTRWHVDPRLSQDHIAGRCGDRAIWANPRGLLIFDEGGHYNTSAA
jgi:hypothetical protein